MYKLIYTCTNLSIHVHTVIITPYYTSTYEQLWDTHTQLTPLTVSANITPKTIHSVGVKIIGARETYPFVFLVELVLFNFMPSK